MCDRGELIVAISVTDCNQGNRPSTTTSRLLYFEKLATKGRWSKKNSCWYTKSCGCRLTLLLDLFIQVVDIDRLIWVDGGCCGCHGEDVEAKVSSWMLWKQDWL